jgi:hypothetical protein
MEFARYGAVAQSQEIDLAVTGEDQICVKKAVNARTFVRVAPVDRKAISCQPRNGTHDAVRLENAGTTVWTERSRYGAERMSFEKRISLV